MKTIKTQVCVIGAGAGGTGVVYRLIKNGIKTVVADKNPDFGGTQVFCGVDGWEPGVSLSGIHTLLKDELEKVKNACHVVETVPNINIFDKSNGYNWENHSFDERPWGLSMPTGKTYEDTMKRCIFLRGEEKMKRFQFEPEEMTKAIRKVLSPYKDNLETYFGYSFSDCLKESGKITSVIITNGKETIKIDADVFVDCSGDIVLVRSAGCEYTTGCEGKEKYNEPSAGEKSDNINAVSYVFRVSPTADKNYMDNIPKEYLSKELEKWQKERIRLNKKSVFVLYPNGDININMLPTMEGKEFFDFGENADEVGKARVYNYWNYLQKEKGLRGYKLTKIYNAGVRESYRLVGKYVLTENDVRAGMTKQPKIGRTVAIADHALDIHGNKQMGKELMYPYEIPLECSMTNEYSNLFVACRGASFSHIAASTVRLTRTMLSFGEGVGEYISEIL